MSDYKYVYEGVKNGKTYYRSQLKINGRRTSQIEYTDEKDCAKAVDRTLIKHGREPVNILKPVKN